MSDCRTCPIAGPTRTVQLILDRPIRPKYPATPQIVPFGAPKWNQICSLARPPRPLPANCALRRHQIYHFLIIEHPCLAFFARNHLSTLGNLCGRFSAQSLVLIIVIVVHNLEERTAGRHEEDSIVVDVCRFVKMKLIRSLAARILSTFFRRVYASSNRVLESRQGDGA